MFGPPNERILTRGMNPEITGDFARGVRENISQNVINAIAEEERRQNRPLTDQERRDVAFMVMERTTGRDRVGFIGNPIPGMDESIEPTQGGRGSQRLIN